jgi:hypothetical protein
MIGGIFCTRIATPEAVKSPASAAPQADAFPVIKSPSNTRIGSAHTQVERIQLSRGS